MAHNILITGAAGYLGGSILDEFQHASAAPIAKAKLYAAVRSSSQIDALSKLERVTPVLLDIHDETAVLAAVQQHEIDMVIGAVASYMPEIVHNVIRALGERRKTSAKPVYYIHSGVLTVFAPESGWPYPGEVKDTDNLCQQQKDWESPHPVRITDLALIDEAAMHDVTVVNVLVPNVYGKGTGTGRKVSVNIPAHVRASIADKAVHRFEIDGYAPQVHVSDLCSLYELLATALLRDEHIPAGRDGYYFGFAHRAYGHAILDGLAKTLYARGLVDELSPRIWESETVAAQKLGFPEAFIRAICTASGEQVAVNAYKLGWKPHWNESRFLASLDDEVNTAIDFDTGSSVFKVLLTSEK